MRRAAFRKKGVFPHRNRIGRWWVFGYCGRRPVIFIVPRVGAAFQYSDELTKNVLGYYNGSAIFTVSDHHLTTSPDLLPPDALKELREYRALEQL